MKILLVVTIFAVCLMTQNNAFANIVGNNGGGPNATIDQTGNVINLWQTPNSTTPWTVNSIYVQITNGPSMMFNTPPSTLQSIENWINNNSNNVTDATLTVQATGPNGGQFPFMYSVLNTDSAATIPELPSGAQWGILLTTGTMIKRRLSWTHFIRLCLVR